MLRKSKWRAARSDKRPESLFGQIGDHRTDGAGRRFARRCNRLKDIRLVAYPTNRFIVIMKDRIMCTKCRPQVIAALSGVH